MILTKIIQCVEGEKFGFFTYFSYIYASALYLAF